MKISPILLCLCLAPLSVHASEGQDAGEQSTSSAPSTSDSKADVEEPDPFVDDDWNAFSPEQQAAFEKRERRHILHNSWGGAVGGFRVVDAGSGAAGAFRVLLGNTGFVTNDWLAEGRHGHSGNVLALSWTLRDDLEVYGAATHRQDTIWTSGRRAFQLPGETTLGAKYFRSPLPWLTVGGDARVEIPFNTVVNAGGILGGTGAGLRASVTADLREYDGTLIEGVDLPILARLNLGYTFNNSSALARRLEQERYDELPTNGGEARRPYGEETRHLLGPVERFGLQMDRVDRFTFAAGFEAPITLPGIQTTISPIAEWVLDIPVNRQGFSCPEEEPGGPDACLADVGAAAFRQSLLLGVRVLPQFRGLNAFAAVELGLTGVHRAVRELAPQAPYRVLFGFSYAHDRTMRRRTDG